MRRLLLATGLLPLTLLTGCGGSGAEPAPAASEPVAEPTAADRISTLLPRFQGAQAPTSSPPAMRELRQLLQAGRLDEARAQLEALVADEPTGEAAFLLGWIANRGERHAIAARWFGEALDHGPGFPKAGHTFYLYGRCLQETGDLDGARAAYEADVALFPAGADGRFRLAQLDFEDGELERCEERARACLERFARPQDVAKTHALLADVHLAREDPEAARAALETCVGIFPHYEALYTLSRVCARLGDDEAAARYLREHQVWRARAGR